MSNRIITTMTDTESGQAVEIYASDTRDHIILIREAIHPVRTGAIREVSIKVQTKDWTLSVTARK